MQNKDIKEEKVGYKTRQNQASSKRDNQETLPAERKESFQNHFMRHLLFVPMK